ncbi:MAG: hypothetical protein FLDDKLPJ_00332 [Phycisphaerae bacterium]|nr:hypothetical protein [Phycisphaerae bacterium]
MLVVLATALALGAGPAEATVDYVRTDGSDTGVDGQSWANAFATLQKAISTATTSGDEIWVKAGTYYPDEGPGYTNNNRSHSFVLQNGVGVYGGFDGTESNKSERDWAANVTILSGDIDQDDGSGDPDDGNSYHVLKTVANASSSTVLDGFTITRGHANTSGTTAGGAGFSNLGQQTSVTFRHCTFTLNKTTGGTGAVYIHNEENGDDCEVTFEDCLFYKNTAGATYGAYPWGGAVYNSLRANTTFRRCRFLGNHADSNGGAVACAENTTQFLNCVFSGNTCDGVGGAVYLHASAWEPDTISSFINCTFSENIAEEDGDALGGGAIYCEAEYASGHNSAQPLVLTVKNSIIWGNLAKPGDPRPYYDYNQIGKDENDGDAYDDEITITVDYTDYETGWSGSGGNNMNTFPDFKDPLGPDDTAGTLDDDLSLGRNSPCTDAGGSAASVGDYDVDGNPRIVDTYCDGNGSTLGLAVIDLGAYEYQTYGLVYVDKDASGDDNGEGWDDAFTDLQDAFVLAAADNEVCEVWVAGGTYKPDDCTNCDASDRMSSFTMVQGVAVYGQFAGNEEERDERGDPSEETILDGLIGTTGIQRVYHVVTALADAPAARLDGFTIKSGKADGSAGLDQNKGGGVFLGGGTSLGATPAIYNCVLRDNEADLGGAVYAAQNAQPVFNVCTFEDNTADDGGAVYATQAAPFFWDCRFIDNIAGAGSQAGRGGGIFVASGSPNYGEFKLIRCRFSGNEAEGDGGAIHVAGSSGISPTLINGLLYRNKARTHASTNHKGGAIYNERAVTLWNCTFAKNAATLADGGGGLYNHAGDSDLRNCIFWENKADGDRSHEADQIKVNGGTLFVVFTCIEDIDSFAGGQNTGSDPLYLAPNDDNYELNPDDCGDPVCASSSIDRAEDDYCSYPCDVADVLLRDRTVNLDNQDNITDRGALETQNGP